MTSQHCLQTRDADSGDQASEAGHNSGITSECPECGGAIVHEPESVYCEACGAISDRSPCSGEIANSQSPTHTSITGPASAGRSLTPHRPPAQVTASPTVGATLLGSVPADEYTNLSATRRESLSRMRQQNTVTQTRGHAYYTQVGIDEIQRIQTLLEIGDSTATFASTLFRQLREDGLTGRHTEALAAACLYAGIRTHDLPHTLGECAQVSSASRHQVEAALKTVVEESPLEPQSPAPFLTRLVTHVECQPDVVHTARRLLAHVEETAFVSGRPPQTIAAATLYAASQLSSSTRTSDTQDTSESSETGQLTQQTIAEKAGLSRQTISIAWTTLQDYIELAAWESRE